MLEMNSKTIRINTPGPPENMYWDNLEISAPSAGHVTLKHSYVGLNYIDTYHRSGLYPLPLPATLGMEAAGKLLILEKMLVL